MADVPAGTGLGSSGAFTVCLLKALALARRIATHARASSPRPRATSRSTCSASRSASRTSTSPRTAASAPTPSTPTARSTSSRCELAGETLDRLRDNLLLFYTGEARTASRCSATRTGARASGDDEMVENLHRTKEIGRREPRAAGGGRPRALRRADARALAEQARALAGHGQRAHRRAVHARAPLRRDRRQARRRGRRRLPARLRAAARRHAPGDGARPARRSCASASTSRAASAHEYA